MFDDMRLTWRKIDSESANEELAAKLNSEIALEKDNQDDAFRESIKEYLDNSDFQIEDVAGQEEVHLTRTYGDEKYISCAITKPCYSGLRDN